MYTFYGTSKQALTRSRAFLKEPGLRLLVHLLIGLLELAPAGTGVKS